MKRNLITVALSLLMVMGTFKGFASSHREAPLISNDPLADNTDLYAFRSPDDSSKITIIACYVPMQVPDGGPNYYSFGENIHYDIHINNGNSNTADQIIYRFTFTKTNEDPTTFFNIRLGKENLKTTYTLSKSTNGGATFTTIVTNGAVPPPNIGPRSISSAVGLNTTYGTLFNNAITMASTGEQVFAGPTDDPFFVDLGGIFDLGNAPRQGGTAQDGLTHLNVSTIALQIPIAMLQKSGQPVTAAANILDGNYVIGVWASASRQQIRTLNGNGTESFSGNWVQVSRLGMPLTNEAVIPVGKKDLWNSMTPYQDLDSIATFGPYFYQPELSLYMDTAHFGAAVPAFAPLQIQRNSLQSYGFGNDQQGLYALTGVGYILAVQGTAFDATLGYQSLLLPNNHSPRSVDIWPIFNTGVPNLAPYQLATGKNGNPLAAGKPFINNFLPNGGDMLRLNMAVPATKRNDPKFSSEGLIQAAVLGLTDTAYNQNTNIQFIPNMDGFPNGRRLEDDVTRIELQAVGGAVLAAIGLWYDDYTAGGPNPVTPDLLAHLTFATGVNNNDTTFRGAFPYVQTPWPGNGVGGGQPVAYTQPAVLSATTGILGLSAPVVFMSSYPNPFSNENVIKFRVENNAHVTILLYDIDGRLVKTIMDETKDQGDYSVEWNSGALNTGTYFARAMQGDKLVQTIKLVKSN